MRATALSLNARPYLDTLVLHRRPRVWFYEGDNYCDAGGQLSGIRATRQALVAWAPIRGDNPAMVSQEIERTGGAASPWRLSVAPMMDWTEGFLSC
jgi:hypothetical protein